MASPERLAPNPNDGELMVKLLSLDATMKLYAIIGLVVEDDPGLMLTIREGLGDQKAAEEPSLRVGRVMSHIAERQGTEVSDLVQRWGAHAFHCAYRAKHVYGYWNTLLGQCRWQEDCRSRLKLPESLWDTVFTHFLSAQDVSGFVDEYEAAAAHPSDWDREMKLNNAFLDADDEVSAPEILLTSLALIERNKRFWQWVVKTLTPEQVEAFYESAKASIRNMPQFAFMVDLSHPKQLAQH